MTTFPSLTALNRNPVISDTLNAISRPGLILVSGTTGTGKSTTLAAMGSEMQNSGYKVMAVRSVDDEVLPGVPEIAYYALDRSTVRSVLGVYQPDVVLIDQLSSLESYKFAVDLAAKDALVIAALPAASPEDAVERTVMNYYHGEAAVSAVMIMSIHQRMVPAANDEYGVDHWDAVRKAGAIMRLANPNHTTHPAFSYRADRKIESDVKVYAPTI